ncbi:MAG: hypothetical protein KDA44_05105 [Planctomycetales bacterium]|nr:hypothetical protein [Planctomycetales bacterium]
MIVAAEQNEERAVSGRKLFQSANVALAALVACGCNSGDSGLAPVSGQVLLDGQPLTTGAVITMPPQGRGARGVIGSDGRFTLSTGDLGEGATIGRHAVAVVAMEETVGLNPEAPRKLLVPQIYTVPETSGLSIDVVADQDNDVVLKLTSQTTTNSKQR